MHRADEIAHMLCMDVGPALYRYNRLSRSAGIVLKIDQSINPLIGTFFAPFAWLAINKRQSPQLEIVRAFGKQSVCAIHIDWDSVDLVVDTPTQPHAIKPPLHDVDCENRYIDTDPLPP